MVGSPEPLLAVRNLRVTLDTPRGPADALRGVDFTLERGATLGLIGESGKYASAQLGLVSSIKEFFVAWIEFFFTDCTHNDEVRPNEK